MFEALYFYIGCAGVIYIIYWSLKNDDTKSIEEQSGFIRMRTDASKESSETPKKKPKWRPAHRRM